MKVSGSVQRIEIQPETDEEKSHLQSLVNWDSSHNRGEKNVGGPIMYWGDSDAFNVSFVINSAGLKND